MSSLPTLQKYAVHQRRKGTGCIPTSFEILLRAAEAGGVDFDSIQDEFDFDQHGGPPKNHFAPIADAIHAKYPSVEFAFESFPKGAGDKKLARLEEFLSANRPVIVSLPNAAEGGIGWHIMVVLDSAKDSVTLLDYVDEHGKLFTKVVTKAEFVRRHNEYAGGDELAYLVKSGA